MLSECGIRTIICLIIVLANHKSAQPRNLGLRRRGAYTIAQDEQASAMGMPKTAVETGAAEDVLSIEKISRVLRETAFSNAMDRNWRKA